MRALEDLSSIAVKNRDYWYALTPHNSHDSVSVTYIHFQLWVFNPNMRYSNSYLGQSVNAQQAMKVFYQHIEDVDRLLNPEMGKVSPLSVEELELPSSILGSLIKALHKSNDIIPVSARKFNEWHVGLLSRFSREQESISTSL